MLRSSLLSPERFRTLVLVLIPVAAVLVAGGLTPVPDLFVNNGDIRVYANDGSALMAGRIPYLQFRSEYPPVAFVMFVFPFLVTGIHPAMQAYAWLYLLESAVLVAAFGLIVAFVGRRWSDPSEPPDGALTTWALLGAILSPLIAWRFDVLPALLSLASVALLFARRPFPAGIALGLSVAAKLYALPLAAVLLVAEYRRDGQRGIGHFLAGLGVVLGVAMLPILLLGGSRAFSFISYQAQRGLQLESVPAGIVELVSAIVGQRATVNVAFGSWELFSPWSGPIVGALPVVMLVVVGAATIAAAAYLDLVGRDGQLRLEDVAAACLVVIASEIVSDKVLSPQYLIWLAPFLPFAPTLVRLAAVVAAALTVAIYPVFYLALRQQHLWAILLLNARNALLVGILVAVGLVFVRALALAVLSARTVAPGTAERPAA